MSNEAIETNAPQTLDELVAESHLRIDHSSKLALALATLTRQIDQLANHPRVASPPSRGKPAGQR